MATAPDKINIDLKSNDKFAADLAGAKAGDKITLTKVTVLVDEISDDLLTASIEEIDSLKVTPAPKEDDDEDEVDENAPVMQVMAQDKAKKY